MGQPGGPRVCARPAGLVGLILASPLASAPVYNAEARRLQESLPPEVQQVIDRHQAEGTTDDDAYVEATMAFNTRWLCRLDPWPDHLMRTFTGLREEVYGAIWGVDWNITGNLKDWDVTARLGELDVPVLITSGRHDLTTPAVVSPIADGIRGAEWVVFEHSAHMPSIEEPQRFRQVVESFLSKAEAADPGP
jgi:proline-specific peptidase